MKKLFWLLVISLIAAIFFYLSRFWTLRLWDRDGLFGLTELRPQGGLLNTWLRGTSVQPFELLIWAVGVFIILTMVQKLYDALTPPPKDDDH